MAGPEFIWPRGKAIGGVLIGTKAADVIRYRPPVDTTGQVRLVLS